VPNTIFERLARGRPAPAAEKPQGQPKELAEALLGWLERWPKPIVTPADIHNDGPRPKYNRETAIRSAQILVAHGHLQPIKGPRGGSQWRIIRESLTPK